MDGPIRSSFDGVISEFPQISVDNFKIGRKAYFLSHCHADHRAGLYYVLEHFLKNDIMIYTSVQTAAILRCELWEQYHDIILPLEIGEHNLTIDGVDIAVSLIPADHCFGAVMFLFRTADKTVLFTGDFRVYTDTPRHELPFKSLPKKLDTLYVDATFNNDNYKNFPKKFEAFNEVLPHVEKWLQANKPNRVALKMSADFSDETVFNWIYQKLKEKVYVAEKFWRVYSQFPNAVPGVTNEAHATRVHLCTNPWHKNCVPGDPSEANYLLIHLSCRTVGKGYKQGDPMIKVINASTIDVIFATHCSKSELHYFCDHFTPRPRTVYFPETG